MNSKKTAAIAGIILCTAFMTGCFPTVGTGTTDVPGNNAVSESSESGSEQSGTPTVSDFPEHIVSRNVDRLNIDADVILPAGFDPAVKTAQTAATFKAWDKDTLIALFSDGHTVTDELSSENTGPDDLIHCLTLDNDSDIVYSDGDIWFNSVAQKEMQYAFYFDNFENYLRPDTMMQVFGNEDIPGIDKNSVIQQANSVLETLQLADRVGEPRVCSVTSEKVNEIIRTENLMEQDDATKEWTSDDDACLLVYPLLYTGLPALQINAVSTGSLYNNTNIWFLYGKSGLIGFRCTCITDAAPADTTAPILSPNQVAEKIEGFFENIIIDAPLNVSLMKLGYLTETSFDAPANANLIPVWLVCGEFEADDAGEAEITEKDEKSVSQQGQSYIALINAVTGESLPVSSIGGL